MKRIPPGEDKKSEFVNRTSERARPGATSLDAAISEGIADIRAGRTSDFGEFLSELESEDRVESNHSMPPQEALDVGLAQTETGRVVRGTPAELMARIHEQNGLKRSK